MDDNKFNINASDKNNLSKRILNIKDSIEKKSIDIKLKSKHISDYFGYVEPPEKETAEKDITTGFLPILLDDLTIIDKKLDDALTDLEYVQENIL